MKEKGDDQPIGNAAAPATGSRAIKPAVLAERLTAAYGPAAAADIVRHYR